MEVKMACPIHYFKVKEGIPKIGCFEIISNPARFSHKFLNDINVQIIGDILIRPFQQDTYFFSEVNYDEGVNSIEHDEANMKTLNSNVHYHNSELVNFLSCLWFIKDNCCRTGIMLGTFPDSNYFSSRLSGFGFCFANGTLGAATTYSIEEIEEGYKYYIKWDEISQPIHKTISDGKPILKDRVMKDFQHNQSNRIERAMYFLLLARTSFNLSQKIAQYIGMYECLFSSNSNSEIIHKISERVAMYVGGDSIKKKATYKLMKNAYDIRSKYVHGEAYTKGVEVLIQTSIDIDNLSRVILRKILMVDSAVFLQDNNSLNEYFNNLIFT